MTQRPAVSAPLILVPTSMDRPRAVLEGLLAATALASDLGASELALAVPQTGTLQGVIEQVLGQRRTAELTRGSTQVQSLRLLLATRRTPTACPVPVLACFTGIAQTAALARATSTTGLVYVPWALEEQQAFQASFRDAQLLATRLDARMDDA